MIDENELWVLSYYRASELAGALLFGRLARRTSDAELAVYLTEHFAEEARHAWMWTETIRSLGHLPVPLTDTYQSQYAREIGIPSSMTEVLVLTQVFEERIYSHFSRHAQRSGINPIVHQTLQFMLEEERGHLDWIREWLDRGGNEWHALRDRYREMDERLYRQALRYEQRLQDFLNAVAEPVS
jgi:rubrerythrin